VAVGEDLKNSKWIEEDKIESETIESKIETETHTTIMVEKKKSMEIMVMKKSTAGKEMKKNDHMLRASEEIEETREEERKRRSSSKSSISKVRTDQEMKTRPKSTKKLSIMKELTPILILQLRSVHST
jgi:hypothetical protein